MKDLSNYGSLRATVDADLFTSGSYEDTDDITIAGMMAVNDFHFGKKPKDDYAAFDKLIITMTEVSPKKYIFHGDSIILRHPYFKYEKYDSLDNIQTMFGKDGQNIDAAKADSAKFNLIIELKDGLSKNENAWGLSKKIGDQRIIYIDTEFYNDYTNGNHRNRIEAIVFHEMGHSIINRRHTTKQNSLMNPDNLSSGSLYEKSFGKIDSVYREQLLDELFNLK
jgi:hypothetical protein